MPYIGQSLTEGTRREYTYVATAGQTTFNAVYTVGAVDVYQNGVLLAPADYTATDGTTVVLSSGAALNDEITIHCHNTFSVADTVSASQGGTFNGPVSVTGTFTSRGIDDNATSTAMTLDASGNLLVGKTSADGGVNGFEARSAGETYITATSATPLAVKRKTSDGALISFSKDGTTVGSIGSRSGGGINVNSQTGSLGLQVAGANTMFVGSAELFGGTDATIDLGINTNRFKDLYLSGGVYLGGTGAANKLDDYEEGTWTPSATSGITIISVQNATYTKVGRQVTLSAWLKVDITAADFVFAGFPFSISGRTCASITNPSTDESIANQCLSTSCYGYGANTAGTNDDFFFSLTYDT